jgi:DNA processing protein
VLFYWGELPDSQELCLALIGSRRVTPYGCQVAEILSRDLAYQGACIVSGMARGIDTICHKAALAAGGRTVAVLGSGLDVIYPRENEQLYRKICEGGAVISEFPLGTPALAANFPRRNRIISGLSRGVVVIEADLHSGTMHTVHHALDQGKDVFAIPGPITSPCSRGTNKLIQDYPDLVMATSAADIWSKYTDQPMQRVPASSKVKLQQGAISEQERQILQLTMTPLQFDELATKAELGLSAATLAATLTMLEIRGLIKQLPGKYYQAVVKHIG